MYMLLISALQSVNVFRICMKMFSLLESPCRLSWTSKTVRLYQDGYLEHDNWSTSLHPVFVTLAFYRVARITHN